jgi:hypothetical protein
VTLARTFLLDPSDQANENAMAGSRMRYTITLRLFPVHEADGGFDFRQSAEQVPLWQDSLIVDVEPGAGGGDSLVAHAAWNSTVPGASQKPEPITSELPPEEGRPLTFQADGDSLVASVPLPAPALRPDVMGTGASIQIAVSPRPPQA